MADFNPHNRYLVAQLVTFSTNELVKPTMNLYQSIGDAKQIPLGAKGAFRTQLPGVKAFVQAKAATTPKSKVASKEIVLDTVAISARPVLNRIEMQTGQARMSDLVAQAAMEIENKQNKYVYDVLIGAASNWSAPYYGSGAGAVVGATIDPMVQHWMRMGGATILGDLAMTSQLGALTGFVADPTSGRKQFGNEILVEENLNGHIGRYKGADVVQMVNPLDYQGNSILPTNALFIIPKGISPDHRPLKILREGDLQSIENVDINDLTYEIRMDQHFGAAMVMGNFPFMSVYQQT